MIECLQEKSPLNEMNLYLTQSHRAYTNTFLSILFQSDVYNPNSSENLLQLITPKTI